jgi:hypothetical protein
VKYIEKDCVVEHAGRSYEAGGAVVTPELCVAYLADGGKVTDWHGTVLGTFKIVASWRTPRSFVSSRMHAVHVTIDGVLYKGRSAGLGMFFRGKVSRE